VGGIPASRQLNGRTFDDALLLRAADAPQQDMTPTPTPRSPAHVRPGSLGHALSAPARYVRLGRRTSSAGDPMADTPRPRSVAAVGLVVQDLDRSIEFYTALLGMQETQRVDVPHMDLYEVILAFPGSRGAAIVLMQFRDEVDRSYHDDGGKVVMWVGDCVAVADAVRTAGYEVTREPAESPGFGMIAMVKDPDGRTVELMGAVPG
jgi:lactoylglutathione lyase